MTSQVKLDLIRGDILVAFGAISLQADIAGAYVQLAADDRLVTLIDDAADRARALVRLKHALIEAKRDAELTAEVAAEFRAERKSAPRTAGARA